MNRFSKDKSIADTKIVVAMSGGVDSSVVAALMVEEGYDVVGITLQLYDHGAVIQKKNACCAGQDIEDARRVCDKIGIPHYVLNYESLFKQSVIEDFADSYMRGETPIPCVRCNQSVKFRDLYKVAKDLEADALVTGHYIRKTQGFEGAELHNAIDANKDQSYFLFATTREQLEYIYFPLGDMTKQETRRHAERLGLIVADKPDSQDICFVPDGNYADIVTKIRPEASDPGDIIDIATGEVVARHDGVINYTRGQRKGLGGGFKKPMYVIKVDAETKQVFIGEEKYLFDNSFLIKELNWIGSGDKMPEEGVEIEVKLRSLSNRKRGKIIPINDNGDCKIALFEPARAITPGQACVLYDDTRILGGGWIVGKA